MSGAIDQRVNVGGERPVRKKHGGWKALKPVKDEKKKQLTKELQFVNRQNSQERGRLRRVFKPRGESKKKRKSF